MTAVIPGEFGKPRPALIVQADAFATMSSMTLVPLTSDLNAAHLVRLTIEPDPENGLEHGSQFMIDKVTTVSRRKIGRRIGSVGEDTMRQVDRLLSRFLGLS